MPSARRPTRFSERAQETIVLSGQEAARLDFETAGTAHVLLGLISATAGVGCRTLQELGVDLQQLRHHLEREIGTGDGFPTEGGAVNYTSRAKRVVLELAGLEAQALGHRFIGTEHLLLALIREKDGAAAKVLSKAGVELESARETVRRLLPPSDS